jgi:hypothetical protein
MGLRMAKNRLILVRMISVIKPSELKAEVGRILDEAIDAPQYVERNGVLLVITKADLIPAPSDDPLLSPWEQRAKTIESFYDPAKAW